MNALIEHITGVALLALAALILWCGGSEPLKCLLFPEPVPVCIGDVHDGGAPESRMVRVRGRFMPDVGFVREKTSKGRNGREELTERSYFTLFVDAAGDHLYVSSDYTQEMLAGRHPGEREITAIVRPFEMRDAYQLIALSQREQFTFDEGSRYLELIEDRRGHLINAGIRLGITVAAAACVGAIGVARLKCRRRV